MVSPIYDKVIIICGNHEYYKTNMTIEEVDYMCKDICRNMPQQNVVFLQNEIVSLPNDIDVFGGTFWTHIPQEHHHYIMETINDYKYINGFTPLVSNALHNKATTALQEYMTLQHDNKKIIVLSHHMPSLKLIDPLYNTRQNIIINNSFATDVHLADDPRIVAWVYGHTHKSYQNGKFYCNPIGYPGENKK